MYALLVPEKEWGKLKLNMFLEASEVALVFIKRRNWTDITC